MRKASGSRFGPRARYLGQLSIVAAAYFGLAKGGLAFAFANQSVTSIWPPTGLALAATLIWGYRMWPAILVGAFLANITTAGPFLAVLGIATGNTLEAVTGAYLLRRLADFRTSLERARDVLALVIFAGILSTTISATIGVASLSAAGLVPDGETLSTWRVWWFGDLGGDLLVAPTLLVLASRPRLERRPWIRAEAAALLVGLAGASVVVFTTDEPLAYIMLPILAWIALRFRQPGTVIAGLIMSAIAIWFTARGDGPFVGGSADAELLRTQTFVGVATITGLLVAALITQNRRFEEQLQHQAEHDPLTDLFNRRRFTAELENWISYNTRYGGRGAVLVIDVDNLKSINDSLGHRGGDQLMVLLAGFLQDRLRETDLVARWGGDEFTVLLPQASEEHATTVAADLREGVRSRVRVGDRGREMQVTVSIGVSQFGEGIDQDAEQVLASADAAMYMAKAAGRDRVRGQV